MRVILTIALVGGCGNNGTMTEGPTSSNTPVVSTPTTSTSTQSAASQGLIWPLGCTPGADCGMADSRPGYADPDRDGQAWDCGEPGYIGHEGVDISISDEKFAEGMPVFAAADATVAAVFDGHHDRCDLDPTHADCLDPGDWFAAGESNGFRRCTDQSSDYCGTGDSTGTYECFWCFDGGNVVILLHDDGSVAFGTRYDHLKRNSITVAVGDAVQAGDTIALAASAGRSSGPHLHFEVWGGGGWYDVTDPWSGDRSPAGSEAYLFANDPAWGGATAR